MHYVYVLSSKVKQWLYIGCTDDLKRRFKEHNNGLVSSTKPYRPYRLLYYEAYLDKADARAREYALKHHSQTKEILYKQIRNSKHHGAIV